MLRIIEAAAVREVRQPYSLDELVEAIELAGRRCLAEGSTTVAEAGIDGFQRAQAELARPDARHRIEHAGLVRPDQLARFAAVKATAVVQPNFFTCLGDDYAAIMDEQRALAISREDVPGRGRPLRAMQLMAQRLTDLIVLDRDPRTIAHGSPRPCASARDIRDGTVVHGDRLGIDRVS